MSSFSSIKLSGFGAGRRRAFTLIELLVVIGIIVLLLGGVGIALSGGNKGAALQSAQGAVTSLLYSARAQAALTGRNAALAVNADANNRERYLRYCVVVVRNQADTAWVPAGEGQYLPAGVYFLPATTPSSTALEPGVDFNGLASSGFDTTAPESGTFNDSQANGWLLLKITPLGRRTVSNDGKLVLTVGSAQPPDAATPVKFSNGQNVRGFIISKYGVGSFINDLSGFTQIQ
jgi:prepilin-type N-terminal cleavage/methylation domain-containing protein